MLFSQLSTYLTKLEKTPSRNKITDILAAIFKKANYKEIDKICYLLLGRISPQYTGIEFNLAEKMMLRAVSLAYDIKQEDIVKKYKQTGDLGDVVQDISKSGVKDKNLSVTQVYLRLKKIAEEKGTGSQERKLQGIAKLLKSLDPQSSRYVVRIPVAKLRLGFSDITILDALSVMETGDKSARKQIEAAYNVTADIGAIAAKVKKKGLKGLGKPRAIPGIPIRASLADRLPNAEKIMEKVGPKVAVEPKFDGLRTQIHIIKGNKGKKIMIFSRNHENITNMFPDIVEAAKKLKVNNAILDGEAIGYNPKTNKFTPFQETVQRKRKYKITQISKKVPIKVFVFDVLHLNGRTLLERPFAERRKILTNSLSKSGKIVKTDQILVDTPQQIKKLAGEYIKNGLEGIMTKKLDAPYKAGGRGFHWVKYKRHTEANSKSSIHDTIDCVLMGAYRGRGKRASFGIGGLLLGVSKGDEKYQTISNLGTGLTDEQFKDMNKRVEKLKVAQKPKGYIVDSTVEPDIWTKPKVVLEILADEITLSPRHTAGRASPKAIPAARRSKDGKGFSLRFPRLIKVRDDKNPTQATTVAEIRKLYKMQ